MNTIRRTFGFTVLVAAMLFSTLLTVSPAEAQIAGNVGGIDHGLAVAVVAGGAAVAGGVITFLVLHNRGVTTGCIAESGGKKTLVTSDKKVYLVSDAGVSLPVGERVKLKGRKSGPSSSPSFQAEKIVKDYGHCQP
ncbi:MAG TPA: hypothetical protein VJN43_08495 [Bryobacteraceae bacterium]|nr:hypothetical protein [Bryobacteraceae bacterium]